MASRWKTFSPNATLPASDVNDVLNPSTADHIPRAVAAGSVACNAPANGSASATVTLPAGRFSGVPIVTLTVRGSSASLGNVTASVVSLSATSLTLQLNNAGSNPFTNVTVYWIAMQM